MNPFKLPKKHFLARKEILLDGIEDILLSTAQFIHESYADRDLLLSAWEFSSMDIFDTPTGRLDHIGKVGYFPWAEASAELDQALSLVMFGHYKNAYDSLRRALELVITGSFFVLDDVERKKALAWMNSKRGTPNFKRAVAYLLKDPIFRSCNEQCEWEKYILDQYWWLCDIIHVKGVKNSFNEISPSFTTIDGMNCPCFHEASCKKVLDAFILNIQAIASTVALSNPVLLVGFDLDSKFGLNTPQSGFFYPGQTELLRRLIVEQFQDFFSHLAETDEGVQSIIFWFNSLPDITAEDIKNQARMMDIP